MKDLHIKKQWSEWLASLPALEHFSVPRGLKPKGFGDHTFTQLHHFADASEDACRSVRCLLLQNIRCIVHL